VIVVPILQLQGTFFFFFSPRADISFEHTSDLSILAESFILTSHICRLCRKVGPFYLLTFYRYNSISISFPLPLTVLFLRFFQFFSQIFQIVVFGFDHPPSLDYPYLPTLTSTRELRCFLRLVALSRDTFDSPDLPPNIPYD